MESHFLLIVNSILVGLTTLGMASASDTWNSDRIGVSVALRPK